ncbi:SpoIIIAH-like family protein [Lysinibacillus sp. KU-BSD001]|uniref:SpoIIIAH-like family protein n=1 Tax=Lysinibacillus sp. KU-BSD001 TaxID=3141328 RepID=UPI0036EF860B
MKVKKRTVWFLTLVCLTAVISVYYLFERPSNFDFTAIFTDDSLEGAILTGVDEAEKAVQTDSYVFEEIRMEIDNERSELRTQLTTKMASDQSTAEEKNEAYNEINALIELESSEAMLEMMIEGLGYTDALVRLEGDKANVTVLTEEISTEQANEIVYLVKNEMDKMIHVTVNPQTSYY